MFQSKILALGLVPVFIGLIIGQLMRLGGSQSSSGGMLMIDIAVIWYLFWAIFNIVVTKKKLILTFPTLLFICFGLVAGSSLLIHTGTIPAPDYKVALFYWFRLALFVASALVTPTIIQTEIEAKRLTHWLIGCGAILTVVGYAQLLIFPDFALMSQFGWDPHEGRLLSTFFDPNYFGMFLVIIISILLARIATKQAGWWQVGFAGLSTLALMLTFSRSSYLALLISSVIILGLRSWRMMTVAMLLIAIISLQVPRIRDRVEGALTFDTTSQDRVESWQESIHIIKNNLIIGVGYNAYGSASRDYNFKSNLEGRSTRAGDSSLLLVTATTGLIGLIIYLGWILCLLWQSIIVYKQKTSLFYESIGLAMLGLIPAYFVHSQFVNSLFYPLILVPFILLSSLLSLSLYKPIGTR